jgi:WD40 repeat protein
MNISQYSLELIRSASLTQSKITMTSNPSVIIHRETTPNIWGVVHEHKFHESSVNSISWAPHDYGLILACASSDGRISVLEYKGDSWYDLVAYTPIVLFYLVRMFLYRIL